MTKKYNSFWICITVIFFLGSHPTQGLDVCATKSLNSADDATDNCPSACAQAIKDGKWLGLPNWVSIKRGMGCMNKHLNYTDSVCGCDNSDCCEDCDNTFVSCTLSCQSRYTGSQLSACLIGCEAKWGICQTDCQGCPRPSHWGSNEEKTTSQKTPSARNEHIESQEELPPEPEQSPEEKELPLTKKLDNHQEPTKP